MNDLISRSEMVTFRVPPKGKYLGWWSGYEINLDSQPDHGDRWRLRTIEGIRGITRMVVTVIGPNLKDMIVERASPEEQEHNPISK